MSSAPDIALTKCGAPRQRQYTATRAKKGMSPADRIKLHVKVDSSTGCWVWQLVLVQPSGYGHITIDRRVYIAHRVSYEAFVGPIPDGLHIDHLCRNRACVNPDHLEPVTCMENTHRSPISHAGKTHCPHGHEYSENNTYVCRRRRQCRTCRDVRIRLWRQMTPEQRAERKAAGLPIVDLAEYFAELNPEVAA